MATAPTSGVVDQSGRLRLVYYCSGHGYGHATRVSALTRHLLGLNKKVTVHIVSSAPKHVFADCIVEGAIYRYAEIDPVVVQPLAYRVDRQKSIEALKLFLNKKDALLERERQWLLDVHAEGVLSDAAFLGCLAAKAAGIPSILVTNFSFDSVYSYFATPMIDESESIYSDDTSYGDIQDPERLSDSIPDVPVSAKELEPLVEQMFTGYRCADLLVLLPGFIPIPSFSISPGLPSPAWIDMNTKRMLPEIVAFLRQKLSEAELLPSLPFPDLSLPLPTRSIISAPLLVRPPTSKGIVYTPEGRSCLLSSIGVPKHLHDELTTKILIVSFGGQVFRKPSRPGSNCSSRNSSREDLGLPPKPNGDQTQTLTRGRNGTDSAYGRLFSIPDLGDFNLHLTAALAERVYTPGKFDHLPMMSNRLATSHRLWVPGAPPASKSYSNPSINGIPVIQTTPPTPGLSTLAKFKDDGAFEEARLLPDPSWIAIVCGVTKEQWAFESEGEDAELPEGFYVAPRDVYMPDLTAVGDVLLGKLGYGTVSECVDSCTAFVYVSRPLFIEEHGLRLLLDREGVGIELSRQFYEAGDWSSAVEDAWTQCKALKKRKRSGIDVEKREREGRDLAETVVQWIKNRKSM